jgi:hypothetical protein
LTRTDTLLYLRLFVENHSLMKARRFPLRESFSETYNFFRESFSKTYKFLVVFILRVANGRAGAARARRG